MTTTTQKAQDRYEAMTVAPTRAALLEEAREYLAKLRERVRGMEKAISDLETALTPGEEKDAAWGMGAQGLLAQVAGARMDDVAELYERHIVRTHTVKGA